MRELTKKILNRRSFFKVGLGTVGTLAAANAVGQMCGGITGAQDIGPFFPNENTPEDPVREDSNSTTPIYLANDNDLTVVKGRSGTASGQVVYVRGRLTDEACNPVPNATIIIWQASESGRYNHKGDDDNQDFQDPRTGAVIKRTLDPSFQSWGKAVTDMNGDYVFRTIVPGYYPAALGSTPEQSWYRPPHIHFLVSAMGFPQFVTQMYFRGEQIRDNDFYQQLNARDSILQTNRISDEQRAKLVVDFAPDSQGIFIDGLVGTFDITLNK